MSLLNDNNLPVVPSNILTKFREPFETFANGVRWNLVADSNDLILVDGNAAGSSYLVISKDPFSSNTETSITSIDSFDPPVEVAFGVSLSQRIVGQEFAIELISNETPISISADVAISSISQTTTVLTVDTTTAHGLVPGDRIGIYGVVGESRLNYSSCVVATIPTTTRFTVTAQVSGTLPSVTTSTYTTGYVTRRPAMNGAKNGITQIFESSTATQSSIYVRGSGSDVMPSGTVNTTHAITVASTASVSPISTPGAYVFQPTSEYRFAFQADRIQAYDGSPDSVSISNNRLLRTQVVPDASKQYKLRYRARNAKGMSVPNVAIISATKSGSATATVTTDGDHGLTAGDYVVIYGVRDQTNFLQSTIPFLVTSTPTTTTFTAAWGASYTGTTYGGYVARINGSVVPGGSFLTPSIQNASIASSILYIIGNANWSVSIGDYVNVYGAKVDGTGDSVGIDGVYRVRDVSTVNIALEPIGSTSIPSTMAGVNCGGAIIKRTDMRIHFARVFDYTRERVEVLTRPDAAGSLPAYINGGVLSTVSTVSTVSTASLATTTLANDIASAALTSTNTSATLTPASGALSHEFNVMVTAVSGTSPTLDVVVQESDDSGTNWYDIYHFPRITATGQYRSPLIPLSGNRIRYVRTVGGTGPSFTNAVNRQQSQISSSIKRQFYNTTLAVNTINSTTPTYFIDGCNTINVIVSMGAVTTTAPVLVLEFSIDAAQWFQSGTDITTSANINQVQKELGILARFVRVRVKTAGSGATLNYIAIKGSE